MKLLPILKSTLLILGLAVLAHAPLRADLNSDLAFTAFSNVDVNALAGGQVLQERGPLLSFPRGITSQALFVLDAAPADVAKKLATWNPASHPELKVWIHQDLPAKPTAADYASLSSLPDNSSVNYLVNATPKLDATNPALQVDKDEVALLTPLLAQNLENKALFVSFWSQLLAARNSNFFSPKFANAKYTVAGGDIKSLEEIKSLLRSDAKVYKDFHPLFANTPVYASTKAVPAALYFDCFDVEGYGALGEGAIFQLVSPAAIQSADFEYYVNSGIYSTIELEKIWPVTINGKMESLVWREDLVSTSNVAYLHGMERMASTMLMLQDVKQGIDAFRAEFK